jgi:hypothetical protein
MGPGGIVRAGDSEGDTDDEDPAAKDADAKALRAVARRQAYNKMKEVSIIRPKLISMLKNRHGRRPTAHTKPSKIMMAR